MLYQVVQSNVLCMFKSTYEAITKGNPLWNQLSVPTSSLYSWGPNSTYIHKPPYFENMTIDSTRAPQCGDAYCLLKLGDTVTTDHISPAGSIHKDSSAAKYLCEHGVDPKDFNSYGSRHGESWSNDERYLWKYPHCEQDLAGGSGTQDDSHSNRRETIMFMMPPWLVWLYLLKVWFGWYLSCTTPYYLSQERNKEH